MNRRDFIAATAAMTVSAGQAQSADDPTLWTRPTPFIDSDHPEIQSTARLLSAGSKDDTATAQSLFLFVRDAVPFGFAAGFWKLRASEVLAAGRGYCNTKSTLFTALLRAAGIPARHVFVEIDAAVLRGLIDTGTRLLDHSYVEVFLDGTWWATDAYIVDSELFGPAKTRLQRERQPFGYGVHHTGTDRWRGLENSFSQYNIADPHFPIARVWGVYDDIGAFYREAPGTWNHLNGLLRAGFGVLASGANERADDSRARG